MPTMSFKTDVAFRDTIQTLAEKKGINTSAYIKLLLTKEVTNELSALTPNGMTVAEEMRIIHSHTHDDVSGPFTTTKSLLRGLRS